MPFLSLFLLPGHPEVGVAELMLSMPRDNRARNHGLTPVQPRDKVSLSFLQLFFFFLENSIFVLTMKTDKLPSKSKVLS